MIKFGLNLHLNSPSQLGDLSKLARLAEECGFARIWWADTNFNWADPYIGLTVCALNTSRIGVGTSATNPISRHPATTANIAASLDVISNGRFTLGIASGDNAVKTIGKKPAGVATLERAISYVRALQGTRSTSNDAGPVPRNWAAPRKIPVYIAAVGPRTLGLAGRIADGFITLGASEQVLRGALESVRSGAKLDGRKANIWACVSTSCYIADTQSKAYDKVRSVVGSMLHSSPHIAYRLASELPPSAREELDELDKAYNYQEHGSASAGHAKVVKDWMIDFLSIAGTIDECSEKIKRLEALGIDEIIMPILDVDIEGFMRTFGREIIPRFS